MTSPDQSENSNTGAETDETRILWIAPNLNHYRIPLLNKLAEEPGIDLSVLAGRELKSLGHKLGDKQEKYTKFSVNAAKSNFHIKPIVYLRIFQLLRTGGFRIVLMPIEKKLLLLILFFYFMKFFFRFKLVSYNHQSTRGSSLGPGYEKWLTKSIFKLYDRIIFYTGDAKEWAVQNSLIAPEKAFHANNTIDTEEIFQLSEFEINSSEKKVVLFIGRLIANKRLELLLEYFEKIKSLLPGTTLNIIGDGPEADIIAMATKENNSVTWQGVLVDENEISVHMKSAHLVFIPGHSGLSIVHAFCYGKPYATIDSEDHGPETAYLADNNNGLLLAGDIEQDCERIAALMSDSRLYGEACHAAYETGRGLSKENWSRQMKHALESI